MTMRRAHHWTRFNKFAQEIVSVVSCCTCGTLVQVIKAVQDILYAATQEEGEACLAAAIQELEFKDDQEQQAVAADYAEAQQHMEDGAYGNGVQHHGVQQGLEGALPAA